MAEITPSKCLPCTVFDHVVWQVQAADGSWHRASMPLGECVLLFTSLDAVNDFINGCEDGEQGCLRPAVFSRSRKEFGRQARQAASLGVIGALFDPIPQTGEAPFLRFAKIAN